MEIQKIFYFFLILFLALSNIVPTKFVKIRNYQDKSCSEEFFVQPSQIIPEDGRCLSHEHHEDETQNLLKKYLPNAMEFLCYTNGVLPYRWVNIKEYEGPECTGDIKSINDVPQEWCVETSNGTWSKFFCYDENPVNTSFVHGSYVRLDMFDSIELNCTDGKNNESIYSEYYQVGDCIEFHEFIDVDRNSYDFIRFYADNTKVVYSFFYQRFCDQFSIILYLEFEVADHKCSESNEFGIYFKKSVYETIPVFEIAEKDEYRYAMFTFYYTDECEHYESDLFLHKIVLPLNRCLGRSKFILNEDVGYRMNYAKDDDLCRNNPQRIMEIDMFFSRKCMFYGDLPDLNVQNIFVVGNRGYFDDVYRDLYFKLTFEKEVSSLNDFYVLYPAECKNGTHSEVEIDLNSYFAFVQYDVCLNDEKLKNNVSAPGGLMNYALKGNCDDHHLRLRNYSNDNRCDGVYKIIREKHICFAPNDYLHIFITCNLRFCNGYSYNDPRVCSSHGKCEKIDKCKCNGRYSGLWCEIDPPNLPINVAEIFLAIVIPLFVIVCLCLIVVAIVVVVLLVISLIFRKKVKDFEKIDDINILLQEQKARGEGKGENFAKFKINEKLFTIDFKKDITMKRKIGEGGSNSVVFLVEYQNSLAAFKCFLTRHFLSDQQDFEEFEKEVKILANVRHKYILSFLGASVFPPRVGILSEYCENGDLKSFLEKNEHFPMKNRVEMLFQIAAAMSYLHSKSIIHRDLKLENILVTKSIECRVMDFGLSKMLTPKNFNKTKTTRIGTSIYMSPEILKSEYYDEKVDVFSFSIVSFIVITGNMHPYGDKVFGIESKVAGNPSFRPKFKKNDVNEEFQWLVELSKKCWFDEPSSRPSFSEIIDIFNGKKTKENVVEDTNEK